MNIAIKKTALGLLSFVMILGAGTLVQAADSAAATPSSSEINSQIQQLREQGKQTKAADQTKMRQDLEKMREVREKYKTQMADLKKQRQVLAPSGNNQQVKDLTAQINALKKQRKEEMKPLHTTFKADRVEAKEHKKDFQEQKKDLRKKKKSN